MVDTEDEHPDGGGGVEPTLQGVVVPAGRAGVDVRSEQREVGGEMAKVVKGDAGSGQRRPAQGQALHRLGQIRVAQRQRKRQRQASPRPGVPEQAKKQ